MSLNLSKLKWTTNLLLALSIILGSSAAIAQDAKKETEDPAEPKKETSAQEPKGDEKQASDEKDTPKTPEAEGPSTTPTADIRTNAIQDEWFDNKKWVANFDDEVSVFKPFDDQFGALIVAPVGGVFFYDLYYFDNYRASVYKSVKNLKDGIAGAQKELKAARLALGLDTPEKKDGDDGDGEEEEKKELDSAALIKIRNGLKSKISAAFDAILNSKLPTEDIQKCFIDIKQPFFALDFQLRNFGDENLKSHMIDLVTAITDPINKLSEFNSQTKKEIAWTIHPDISGGMRTDYLRGKDTKKIDDMIIEYEEFDTDLTALIESNKIAEKGGAYHVAQVEGTDGKMTDAVFEALNIPFIVLWLVVGAIFFTVRMSFINIRGFGHAIKVTKGDYDDPNDPGEISHFQALSSALSATVGLGNIAGVAIAVSIGGPGALVWMIMAGFLGMTSKFTECTLGQMYRKVDNNGNVLGGPMRYLSAGLGEMGLGFLGKILAVMFVILCIGGSFGGGNMFQANQSFAAVSEAIPFFQGKAWLYGLILAFLVGLVILGGIKRIGTAAGVIVPFMCLIYVLAGLFVIIMNIDQVPSAFATMFSGAFSPEAGKGGLIGVLVVGFQRAAFSNEAGTGSASIAHSAASTDEPVREGIVALLEPFIDTIVVCTMTGLVVVITGVYASGGGDGVVMTSNAFAKVLPWFPYVLSVAVVLFAFSTMISWSYYGERCAIWLFGESASVPYKFIFLIFVFLGAVLKLGNVLDFSDLMILGMAFPNILGLLLLSGKVRRALDEYNKKLDAGEFDRDK